MSTVAKRRAVPAFARWSSTVNPLFDSALSSRAEVLAVPVRVPVAASAVDVQGPFSVQPWWATTGSTNGRRNIVDAAAAGSAVIPPATMTAAIKVMARQRARERRRSGMSVTDGGVGLAQALG